MNARQTLPANDFVPDPAILIGEFPISNMDPDRGITRRSALAALASATLGLAMKNPSVDNKQSGTDPIAKLLPNCTERSRDLLRQLFAGPHYSGQIPPLQATQLAQNEHIPVEKLMLTLLPLAQNYSQAPISNFHVGVVVRGASGALYAGANIEIPGQCLGFAVHAEQSALSNAYMHSEQSVTHLAVGAAPCGHCRQFMEEMSPVGQIVILIPNKPATLLSSLLPDAFGPAALGRTHGAFPVQTSDLRLTTNTNDPLTMAALDAARKAYAPYSKSPSGVALSTKNRIYRGSYIENVAFNPSLSPLQTALAALIAGGESYSDIAAVALVEVPGATITHRPVTETVLAAIAPNIKLTVVPAHT